MADDDAYWNASNAKGFSWDDASDNVNLPSTSNQSISSNTSGFGTDIVSFESVVTNVNSKHADRVNEAHCGTGGMSAPQKNVSHPGSC